MTCQRSLCCLAAALLCLGQTARADEPVFLSVTREETPMDRLPSNISVITPEDIEAMGAKTLDEVLGILPSVDVTRTGSLGTFSTVRMRGVPSSGQVQILVDDQPLGGVSLQFVDLSQIPLDNVERIEVVRGGSSVLYGANTMGGVVHIITKRHTAEQPTSMIGIEGRSYQTQIYRAEIGGQGHGFDGTFNASRYFTDGFQENSDSDDIAVSGKGGYTFPNGGNISLALARTDHDVGDPQGTPVPFDQWDGDREREAIDPNGRVEKNTNTGRLKIVWPLGPVNVESMFYGYTQDYILRASAGAAPFVDRNDVILGNDTRFYLPGKLLLGASYERDEQLPEGGPNLHSTNWGAYLQKTITAGSLDILPALRLDQHSAFGNTWNPRLSLVYRVSDDWKLSTNAGRSFRAPTLVQLYQDFPAFPPFSGPFNGNRGLQPETAWTYDLGTQHQLGDKIDLGVTGFYTRISDRIYGTNDPAPAANTNLNGPSAELSGAEVELTHRMGRVVSQGNYTYQRALGNSAAFSHFLPLAFTPRHMANHRLTVNMRAGWSLINVVQYVHKQYSQDGEQGVKLPSYGLWDVRLTKKILAAEAFFAVNNLTDKRYAETVTFGNLSPPPARNFSGGLTIRFTD